MRLTFSNILPAIQKLTRSKYIASAFTLSKKNDFHNSINLLDVYQGETSRILTLLGNKTQSVNHLIINKKIPIENLSIQLVDNKYSLPWFIREKAVDLLIKSDLSKSYNGATLRVNSIKKIGEQCLRFYFSYSCYYDYVVTNQSRDERLFRGLTVRSALEPGPFLNPLEASLPENHLGLSSLFVTTDGWTPLFLRSKRAADFAGSLSPSISGAANVDTFSDKELNLSFKNWFDHEMHEEVSPGLNLDQFASIDLIGISRELIRLGKPEVFFIAQINISKQQFESLHLRDNGHSKPVKWWEISSTGSPIELNLSENVRHIWINLHDLFSGGRYQIKSHDGLLSIFIDDERYLLSESLSANLAFAEAFTNGIDTDAMC